MMLMVVTALLLIHSSYQTLMVLCSEWSACNILMTGSNAFTVIGTVVVCKWLHFSDRTEVGKDEGKVVDCEE